MKKILLALGMLLTQAITGMQPQGPIIHNRTIIIPSDAQGMPVVTPTRGPLGPVFGGFPPYTYRLEGHPAGQITVWNNLFIISTPKLPLTFQYSVTDSLGHRSAPATITVQPGANAQEETVGLSETEPG